MQSETGACRVGQESPGCLAGNASEGVGPFLMASQIHGSEHRVVEGVVRGRGLHRREWLMLEAVEHLE